MYLDSKAFKKSSETSVETEEYRKKTCIYELHDGNCIKVEELYTPVKKETWTDWELAKCESCLIPKEKSEKEVQLAKLMKVAKDIC